MGLSLQAAVLWRSVRLPRAAFVHCTQRKTSSFRNIAEDSRSPSGRGGSRKNSRYQRDRQVHSLPPAALMIGCRDPDHQRPHPRSSAAARHSTRGTVVNNASARLVLLTVPVTKATLGIAKLSMCRRYDTLLASLRHVLVVSKGKPCVISEISK